MAIDPSNTANLVSRHSRTQRGRPTAFTLVEVLTATAITLMLLITVTTLFAFMAENVTHSRAAQEMHAALRGVQRQLELDLQGVTAKTLPPLNPADGMGYFEIVEGTCNFFCGTRPGEPLFDGRFLDPTVGDHDDMLLFTTRSVEEPFVGRHAALPGGVATSRTAEVSWFMRGNVLYRRQLLVLPGAPIPFPPPSGFYANYDISVRQEGGRLDRKAAGISPMPPVRLVPNSLGDLTNRENRYGHQPLAFPHTAWSFGNAAEIGLPTLRECSFFTNLNTTPQGTWPLPLVDSPSSSCRLCQSLSDPSDPFALRVVPPVFITCGDNRLECNSYDGGDMWYDPYACSEQDRRNGAFLGFNGDDDPTDANVKGSTRAGEDIVLTHVLSFDVMMWDPGAPVFYDANLNATVIPQDYGYENEYVVPFVLGTLAPGRSLQSFGAYVNLGYLHDTGKLPDDPAGGYNAVLAAWELANLGAAGVGSSPRPKFGGPGNMNSREAGDYPNVGHAFFRPLVYDTWSTSYERDGLDQDHDGLIDEGSNGLDDDGVSGADDWTEPEPWIDFNQNNIFDGVDVYIDQNGNGVLDWNVEQEAPPPYRQPLRGIQIRIRCLEPDSRQIREVTIVHEFLPE